MPMNTNPTSVIRAEDRRQMIQEAAYYRYVQRGYVDGYDVDDWLEAEAEFVAVSGDDESGSPASVVADKLAGMQPQAGLAAEADLPESAEVDDIGDFPMHQSGARGARQDEALKRMIRHHPQRNIANVEGIDIDKAPVKE